MINTLIENKDIEELTCGLNFSYILQDNTDFQSIEYKVLQSQVNSCFVKCMKMLHNGKVQIYYITKDLKPFSSIIPTMDADSFLTIVTNLFASIIAVKSNGFLTCRNVDISFEKIFVDPTTYKVSLVYLPISKKIFRDYGNFENDLRTNLIKLISGVSTISSPKTVQLAADLSNGMLTIEDLYGKLSGGQRQGGNFVPHKQEKTHTKAPAVLYICSLNAPVRLNIAVTKDEFVLGRKKELCDGVIPNGTVSKQHCKIIKKGTEYLISDLGTPNGTYVNKVRLQPGQQHVLRNGDIVRLSNSDFQVIVK